jgi:hypothetical protein
VDDRASDLGSSSSSSGLGSVSPSPAANSPKLSVLQVASGADVLLRSKGIAAPLASSPRRAGASVFAARVVAAPLMVSVEAAGDVAASTTEAAV